jgi:hypothetical protein
VRAGLGTTPGDDVSFLHSVRLVFAGRFQADTSTVNNDVRHYDNQTFRPSFQEFQSETDINGMWNPSGSGAFRLLECEIVAVHYADGTAGSEDAALGLSVAAPEDRTSGKLVDLDPQWQFASTPWGFGIRLTDGVSADYVGGAYRPHAFRDLWFGRMLGATGDGAAAAVFQSVLVDVQWAADLGASRVLSELKEACQSTGMLSVRMTTFGYRHRDPSAGDFTTGMVSGVIGPQLTGEPESYIAGRRFAPANGTTSWNGCGYSTCRVDRASRRLFLDLSNGLQLQRPNNDPSVGPVVPLSALHDIGALSVGILTDPAATEFTPAAPENFLPIGEIDYRQGGWLGLTGGVTELPLTDEHLALIDERPLALAAAADLNTASGFNGEFGQIAIRETLDGLFVEAEPTMHRIDAPGSSTATLRTLRYGLPVAGAQLSIRQLGRMPNQGGGPQPDPSTPIPDIGLPTEALRLAPSVVSEADGTATLDISATDPGNPRTYLDGQVYLIDFRVPGQGNQARSSFDYIVVHVRDAFTAPPDPTWSDIAPIMKQYANLYPVMSRGLFDLSEQTDVDRHAKQLHVAFSAPIEDPNHMPVTRDLSQAKREMILTYLQAVIAAAGPATRAGTAPATPRAAPERPTEATDSEGGKTTAAREFLRAMRLPGIP